MKKTMFLAALMGAALCSTAMAEVTYNTVSSWTAGDALTLGATTSSTETDILITLDLTKLGEVSANTDLVTTKNANTGTNVFWGLRALEGGTVTANWKGGNFQADANSTPYSTIAALDTESTGSVTLVAVVGTGGVHLKTTDGTSVFSNSGCVSTTHAIESYTIDGTGVVTSANKAIGGTSIVGIAGEGTMALDSNATVNGGADGGEVTIDLNGRSLVISGDTTLKKVGAYTRTAKGITVKEGATLTAAIDSSWNPGNISLEEGAAIEASYITLSTNDLSNVTGQGSVNVAGDVTTFNGAKMDTSVSSFTVGGNVNLGDDSNPNAGKSDKLTVSGGTFTVNGDVTVLAGRTLEFTGGTSTIEGELNSLGTVIIGENATVNIGSFTNIGGNFSTAAAMDIETDAVTLSAGNVITLGGEHDGTLTTSALTVSGNATINADLVLANGAEVTFNGGTVTLGCSIKFGENSTVALGTAYESSLKENGHVLLFQGVDEIIGDLSTVAVTGNFVGGHLYSVEQEDGSHNIYATPEPATATLSLLALAGLMARRKRH